MREVHRVEGFRILIKQEEIARILGYGRKRIPRRISELLNDIEQTAMQLISPACAYRFMKNEEFAASEYLRRIDTAALCLVTIGGKLEEAVEENKKGGDLSRALILDTYGSAAAEAAADAAEAIIREKLGDQGLKCSARFSPGYSGWRLEEQRWILPALEGEALGVRLTEGCMMVPRKSITFAVIYGESPIEIQSGDICSACDMVNCKFKHAKEKSRRPKEKNEA